MFRLIISKQNRISTEWIIIIAFTVIKLCTPFLTDPYYDHHIDGYFHAALSDKLDWGFISVPPSIAVFSKLSFILFGKGDFALRFFPALVGGISVLLIGASVKEMGGKKTAMLIACSAFLISPSFLRSNNFLTPNPFDQFYWLLASYLIIRLIKTENTIFWIYLGIVFGIAFMNKYSFGFLAFAFLIALAISSKRKLISSKYFICGIFIGFAIVLPNLIWQANHNWPVLFHMKVLYKSQLIHVQVTQFLLMQILMNLPSFGIWLFGLFYLLFSKKASDFKILGMIYVIVVVEMLIFKGKFYYIIGIYSILLAAGAVAIEEFWNKKHELLKWGVLSFMIVTGLFLIPFGLPVLKEDAMIKYCRFLKNIGIIEPMRWNNGEIHDFPHDYAIMTGSRHLGEMAIGVFNKLDQNEKDDCFIYCGTYGIASIVKFFGDKNGLPAPICYEDNFVLWDPENMNKNVMIYINYHQGSFLDYFNCKVKVGEISNANSFLNGVEIFLCKDPSTDFRDYYHKVTSEMKNNFRQ